MKLEEVQKLIRDKKLWVFIVIIVFILLAMASTLLPEGKTIITGIEPPTKPAIVKLRVTRVEPLPDQKDVSTAPTIKIFFDRKINSLPVKIVTTPEFEIKSTLSPKGFNSTLEPKATLKALTKYTIDILLEKVKIYSWSFTTGKVSTPADVVNKIKDQLPFKGEHFRISYWSSTDKFFIAIDAEPVDKYKAAATDWLKVRGLSDPENQINIVYIPIGEASQTNLVPTIP